MTDVPDQFEPVDGTVDLFPTAVNIGYTRAADGQDAVMVYLETDALGAFKFLLPPAGALAIAHELTGVAAHFDDFRRKWDDLNAGGAQ